MNPLITSIWLIVVCGVACYAQEEIVFAELGGVQLVSSPIDLGRSDYAATIVELRTVDPKAKIVTYTNIAITGNVHQVHGPLTSALTPEGNPFPEAASALYGICWGALDTHLLLDESSIAGGTWSFLEGNDRSTFPFASVPSQNAESGIGSLRFSSPSDAFFVAPELQLNSIDFAYIVTPIVDDAVPDDAVQLTLGLSGSGIIGPGESGGAAFGYNGNPIVNVPFAVPEPSAFWGVLAALAAIGTRRYPRAFATSITMA